MTHRPIRLIGRSPAQTVLTGAVVLYEQTWEEHIQFGHGDVDLEHIRATLNDPCYIHDSKSRPADTVVFTNEQCTNEQGDPLWVPVRRSDTSEPNFVTTAYYKQSATPGTIRWKRGDD